MEDKNNVDQGRRHNVMMNLGTMMKMKSNRIRHVKDVVNQRQDYNRLEIQFQRQIDKDRTNSQIKK